MTQLCKNKLDNLQLCAIITIRSVANNTLVQIMNYKDFFNKYPVFTLDEYNEVIQKNKNTAYNNLMNYIIKGRVKSIRRGLYAVVPQGSNSENFKVDEILVTSRLTKDAVLAFHTALEVMGYSHSVLYRYFYYTDTRKRKIHINNREYVSVQSPVKIMNRSYKSMGVQEQMYHNLNVTLTDRERTFVDCLNKPDFAGGIEEVYRSIEKYPYLEFDKILEYLAILKSKVLYARVGFFLEQHRKQFFVENDVLKSIKINMPASVVYFDPKRKNGKLMKEWNLIVPENVLEKKWEEFKE